jgi:hypothetical protein
VPLWMFPVAWPAATPSSSSPPRRIRPSLRMAELLKQAGLPDGVFNVVNGDKEVVDVLLTDPRSVPCRLSAPPPSPSTSMPPPRPTASGCRPWAAPRTTWWSCRMPIWIRRFPP